MALLDARMKVLVKNVMGSAVARFANLFITLAMVPLTINALSPTDYAYFAMAISLSVLATYADLGMGLAVVNVIAQRGTRPHSAKAQRAVSVVWFSLLGIAAAGLVVVLLLAGWVYFGASATDAHQYNAMLLAAGCVFAGLPTGLVQRVLFAEQKTIQANAWSTGARVVSLAIVWILVSTKNTGLLALVFAAIGVPMLIGWLSAFIVLSPACNNSLRPVVTQFRRRLLPPYLVIGLSFLTMQLVPYAETGLDILLIGQVIDFKLVPVFDVYSKIFTYVPALISIGAFPLWPAIANAKARNDERWIAQVRRWSYLIVAVIALAVSTVLVVFSEEIMMTWLGKRLSLPIEAMIAMGVFAVLTCIGTVQSMMLSGFGEIRKQVAIYSLYIAVLIVCKTAAAWFFGLSAMLWILNAIYFMRLYSSEVLINKHLKIRLSIIR